MHELADIEMKLEFDPTGHTPATTLIYRAQLTSTNVVESVVNVGDSSRLTTATASIVELAHSYPQKKVRRMSLKLGDATYEDNNGDGYVECHSAFDGRLTVPVWQIVRQAYEATGTSDVELSADYLYEAVSQLCGDTARAKSFVATCGSIAADVLVTRTHNILWASIPARSRPNDVHRHLGGSVHCLFFKGQGHLHRVDPKSGFETVKIDISDTNAFQMIAIPTHLWYQPINTGDDDLEYFMIHAPAFDPSELLVLERDQCRGEWKFEYECS